MSPTLHKHLSLSREELGDNSFVLPHLWAPLFCGIYSVTWCVITAIRNYMNLQGKGLVHLCILCNLPYMRTQ